MIGYELGSDWTKASKNFSHASDALAVAGRAAARRADRVQGPRDQEGAAGGRGRPWPRSSRQDAPAPRQGPAPRPHGQQGWLTSPSGPHRRGSAAAEPAWHHAAAVYQVYLRSFADGNGDGIGDLAGLRARLPYLRDLGVDAIWLTPWYVSPMADGGYDVADYRDIDPVFGTLAEAEALIRAVHDHSSRSSSTSCRTTAPTSTGGSPPPWRPGQARPSGPGSGSGPAAATSGELPPNDWQSMFGGPAWTRVTEPDGSTGEWYLHLYAAEQPDLNWDNPEVRAEFEDILRFWLDRGVDGFRIDVADFLVKDPALPDVAGLPPTAPASRGRTRMACTTSTGPGGG